MSGPPAHGSHQPAARWVWGLGAVAVVGAIAYIGLVDPHNPGAIFPICPFRLLTGLNCPGCGALRMIYDVLHGDLAAAVNDNVMLLVGLPLLTGWTVLRRRLGRWPLTLPAAAIVLVTLTAWTVVRNLPGFPLVPTLLTR